MTDSVRNEMTDTPNGVPARLRKAREAAGIESAYEAARALGIPEPTYASHENGSRGFTKTSAQRYADFFRVNLEWLLTGRGQMRRQGMLTVSGTVGAGGEVLSYDGVPPKGGFKQIVIGQTVEEGDTATEIETDGLYPFKAGWKLIWNPGTTGVPAEALNQLCVVRLADGGPTLVKIVRRGRTQGTYTLETWNAPPQEDVRLASAARIKAIVMG